MQKFLSKSLLSLSALLTSLQLGAFEKITVDTWSEYSDGKEFDVIMQGLIMEFKWNEKFTFITASAGGMQIDEHTGEKKATAKDLALYPKYTFFEPDSMGVPGLSLMLGTVVSTGQNFLSSKNQAYMAIGSFPMNLFDERVSIDAQIGHRHIDIREGGSVDRLYWGVFAEANMYKEYNAFTNIYTGTQFDIDVPSLSQEYGLSYDYNKYIKYKMLFGIQPELDGVNDAQTTEYWGELGMEIYIFGEN